MSRSSTCASPSRYLRAIWRCNRRRCAAGAGARRPAARSAPAVPSPRRARRPVRTSRSDSSTSASMSAASRRYSSPYGVPTVTVAGRENERCRAGASVRVLPRAGRRPTPQPEPEPAPYPGRSRTRSQARDQRRSRHRGGRPPSPAAPPAPPAGCRCAPGAAAAHSWCRPRRAARRTGPQFGQPQQGQLGRGRVRGQRAVGALHGRTMNPRTTASRPRTRSGRPDSPGGCCPSSGCSCPLPSPRPAPSTPRLHRNTRIVPPQVAAMLTIPDRPRWGGKEQKETPKDPSKEVRGSPKALSPVPRRRSAPCRGAPPPHGMMSCHPCGGAEDGRRRG